MLKSAKKQINKYMQNIFGDGRVIYLLRIINWTIFHWKERKRELHYGKEDPDKWYYIIRPESLSDGLLSLYIKVYFEVKKAEQNKWIPYIDFNDKKCQYRVNRLINGSNNAWEYYFTQPVKLDDDYLRTKKNVIISGWGFDTNDVKKYDLEYFCGKEFKEFLVKYGVNDYTENIANSFYSKHFISGNTLGVFVRGTDYIKMKPRGHYVQPTVKQLEEKIDKFLLKYDIRKIFVVTEDKQIYDTLKYKYKNKIFTSDNYFVDNYSGSGFINTCFRDDPYERGLRYIVRLLLLSRSDYLITSLAGGSRYVLALGANYKDKYIFDLGKY